VRFSQIVNSPRGQSRSCARNNEPSFPGDHLPIPGGYDTSGPPRENAKFPAIGKIQAPRARSNLKNVWREHHYLCLRTVSGLRPQKCALHMHDQRSDSRRQKVVRVCRGPDPLSPAND
jgi:hypothetical protein